MGNIREYRMLLSDAYKLGRPEALKKKTFIPTSPLPRLDGYEGDLSVDYWEEVDHRSWVDPDSLWEVCSEAGVQNIPHAKFVTTSVMGPVSGAEVKEGYLPTALMINQ